MAKFVMKNCSVKLGSSLTELVCKQMTLDLAIDAPDVTDFKQLTRHHLAGLKNWTGSMEINQQDTASPHAILWVAVVGGLQGWRMVDDATSPNVLFSGNVIITGYTPYTGAVGDGAVASATFQGTGQLNFDSSSPTF